MHGMYKIEFKYVLKKSTEGANGKKLHRIVMIEILYSGFLAN